QTLDYVCSARSTVISSSRSAAGAFAPLPPPRSPHLPRKRQIHMHKRRAAWRRATWRRATWRRTTSQQGRPTLATSTPFLAPPFCSLCPCEPCRDPYWDQDQQSAVPAGYPQVGQVPLRFILLSSALPAAGTSVRTHALTLQVI